MSKTYWIFWNYSRYRCVCFLFVFEYYTSAKFKKWPCKLYENRSRTSDVMTDFNLLNIQRHYLFVSFCMWKFCFQVLVGKVLDNRKLLIKGSFQTQLNKTIMKYWNWSTNVVKKSKIINMKSSKENHGLKTVFYFVLVVNIWWFIKNWSHKIPTIEFGLFSCAKMILVFIF